MEEVTTLFLLSVSNTKLLAYAVTHIFMAPLFHGSLLSSLVLHMHYYVFYAHTHLSLYLPYIYTLMEYLQV